MKVSNAFLILLVIQVLLIAGLYNVLTAPSGGEYNPERIAYQSGLTGYRVDVVVVGDTSDYVDSLIDRFVARGMDVEWFDLDDVSGGFQPSGERPVVIIFYGDWLASNMLNPELRGFITSLPLHKVSLVAVDGNTSSLFDLLYEVGIYTDIVAENGVKRNPAHFNPVVAGYRHITGVMPNGSIYYYPSILVSNPSSVDGVVNVIVEWASYR